MRRMRRRARHWPETEKEARATQAVDVSFYKIICLPARSSNSTRHSTEAWNIARARGVEESFGLKPEDSG